jgi:hypothetical protein
LLVPLYNPFSPMSDFISGILLLIRQLGKVVPCSLSTSCTFEMANSLMNGRHLGRYQRIPLPKVDKNYLTPLA